MRIKVGYKPTLHFEPDWLRKSRKEVEERERAWPSEPTNREFEVQEKLRLDTIIEETQKEIEMQKTAPLMKAPDKPKP
jgi:hypothetical protein